MAWSLTHRNTAKHDRHILYHLKEALKASPTNWTVVASGDGLSTVSVGSDVITHENAGAGGFGNANAWICLQQPSGGTAPYSGTRKIVFQALNNGFNAQARIAYSSVSGTVDTSACTATQCPTFANERIVVGGGTPASPTYGPISDDGNPNSNWHILAGGPSENFSWLCFAANASGDFLLGMDACRNPNASDTDPFIFLNYSSDLAGRLLISSENTYGGLGEYPAGFLRTSLYNTDLPDLNAVGNSFDSNKDQLFTPYWMRTRTDGGSGGYKGKSTLFRSNYNAASRIKGDLFSVSATGDRAAIVNNPSAVYTLVTAHWDNTVVL